MAADGTELKLCIGERNAFNRLVINSRDLNYQIVHVTIDHLSDFSKSAVVEESKLKHCPLMATVIVTPRFAMLRWFSFIL